MLAKNAVAILVLTLSVCAFGSPASDEHAVIIQLEGIQVPAALKTGSLYRRAYQITALRNHADASQKQLLEKLQKLGAKDIRPLWINNSIACTLPVSLLAEIMQDPKVKGVVRDSVVTLDVPAPVANGTPLWNLDLIEVPLLWLLGQNGQGVVVANLDTGADLAQSAIAAQYRGGSNSWFDPSGQHSTPYDASGHGTQTLSLMVGGALPVNGVLSDVGVAPGAKWISAKIFDDSGNAKLSNIHASFQWLLDPDNNPVTDDAPDVVNASWGFSDLLNQCYGEFQADIARLQAADIVVVAAGGNAGPNAQTSMSPANYHEVIGVGAVGKGTLLSGFSSRGGSPCGGIFPIVVAPGEALLVADKTSGGTNTGAVAFASGTSYASPQVAGVAALLRGAFPQASRAQIESALKGSAEDLGTSGADNGYGYGLVRAVSAYNFLRDNKVFATTTIPNTPSSSPQVGSATVASGCNQDQAPHPWMALLLAAALVLRFVLRRSLVDRRE